MVEINKLDIDFEINITLTKNQLAKSNIWDKSLDSKTNFHGYIDDHKKMEKLFCDNTILISTSVIETIGLHVVEAIKNGVVTITPQLSYASEVYGDFGFSYNLFDKNSLFKTIMAVVSYNKTHTNKILSQQKYLRENEMSKFKNIVAVYREILNV
jgi:glycosyltransferase involved in cell wall biosynthesis